MCGMGRLRGREGTQRCQVTGVRAPWRVSCVERATRRDARDVARRTSRARRPLRAGERRGGIIYYTRQTDRAHAP